MRQETLNKIRSTKNTCKDEVNLPHGVPKDKERIRALELIMLFCDLLEQSNSNDNRHIIKIMKGLNQIIDGAPKIKFSFFSNEAKVIQPKACDTTEILNFVCESSERLGTTLIGKQLIPSQLKITLDEFIQEQFNKDLEPSIKKKSARSVFVG